jgi:hypothetical protein
MAGIGGKLKLVLFLAGVIFIGGCGPATSKGQRTLELDCEDGAAVRTELFFGLGKPDGGVVSESEWQQFVEEYITPRFKNGLTVVDASGQWMDKNGKITAERTRIVILLHDGREQAESSIEYIRDKYKQLFGQESVLRISTCAEVVY